MEPVSLIIGAAVAGGAASKLAEFATEYLRDLLHGEPKKAQEAAFVNAANFFSKFSDQMTALERRLGADEAVPQIEPAIADPDVAISTKLAITVAARTSSEEKHVILARAVLERLCAQPESIEAVASNGAIEAVAKLSGTHIAFLGLAAVVYAVRPPMDVALRRIDPVQEGHRTWQPQTGYVEWLENALRLNALGVALDELYLVHLAASACILYERKMRKDLEHTLLRPYDADWYDPRSAMPISHDLVGFLHFDHSGKELQKVWRAGMQHATLTPVGVLIGSAVHQAKSSENLPIAWNHDGEASGKEVDDAVWDGRRIDEKFLRALDEAVRNRAERGLGPWRPLA